MKNTTESRPELCLGARVRLLGGGTGRIIALDHGTPGRWVIELAETSGYTELNRAGDHICRWPGEFHVIPDQEGQQP